MILRVRRPAHVAVVGAGLSGLSAAMHLAGRGVRVTVLERGNGYRLDTGTTVPEIMRVFTFKALYAGVPPQRALAVYAVITYMDTVAGAADVDFRYNTTVTGLVHNGGVVSAVGTDGGRERPGLGEGVHQSERQHPARRASVPGVGVPTAVIDGRLAAERLTESPSQQRQTVVVR